MSDTNVPEIQPEDVEKVLKSEDVDIIDVRELDEYENGHIPGIKLIPLSEFVERYQEIDPNKETILVCRSGARSGRACQFLMHQGYKNVKSMVGGMLAWTGEVEK
jgi:rhodanese-related sulfurtransferase